MRRFSGEARATRCPEHHNRREPGRRSLGGGARRGFHAIARLPCTSHVASEIYHKHEYSARKQCLTSNTKFGQRIFVQYERKEIKIVSKSERRDEQEQWIIKRWKLKSLACLASSARTRKAEQIRKTHNDPDPHLAQIQPGHCDPSADTVDLMVRQLGASSSLHEGAE